MSQKVGCRVRLVLLSNARECHKFLLFTCDVALDARLLHTYHMASVQVQFSVDLVDGVVRVDSVFCDCVTGLLV